MKQIIFKLKLFIFTILKKILKFINVEPEFVKAVIRHPKSANEGLKIRRWPWPRRKHIGKEERCAAIRVLNRELRQGNSVVYGGVEESNYCNSFANYLGGGHALVVNSGTNAVYVAIRALDLQAGSEVIVPPITDPGGTMPVAMLNCIPSMEGSLNTSIDQIKSVISDRTSAIVVAHIAGNPVDLDPILELATSKGIPVIEDCAQAHGAIYKGKMVGTMGDISAFSTMLGKHHCTGTQGGVVFTKNSLLFARPRHIKDRGKPSGTLGMPGNVIASLNFNQDEISMAIGRVQLEKLPNALHIRRAFADIVESGVRKIDGVSMEDIYNDSLSSYWFLMLYLDFTKLSCDNVEFARALEGEGIGGVTNGYPFYPTDQPWHRDAVVFGTSGMPWSLLENQNSPHDFKLPNAHDANKKIVRVDVHESLGQKDAYDLVAAIAKIATYFSRR